MDRAGRDRAIAALLRVLGIGLSWALGWLAFWVSIGALLDMPDRAGLDAGDAALRQGLMGLLLGIAFGVAVAIAGRGRRVSRLSLVLTLVCAFFACALVQVPILLLLPLDLETGVRLALATCVFGQFVTMLWHAAVRGGERAFALIGRRS